MDEGFDPHGLKTRYESELRRIKELPEKNRDVILDFLEHYRFKKKPLSIARKSRLAFCLRRFALWLGKPLKPFKEKEIQALVKAISDHESQTRKTYSLQTWREFTKNIKIWVKWANPTEYPTILVKSKGDLEVQNPYSSENNQARKARIDEFLISEETFVRLLNAGDTMEKALLAVGFGCGPRAGEVMALKRKDIAFDSENRSCSISFIESKTFSRPNVLLSPDLTHYVRDWFEESPKKDVNDFVFLIQNGGYKPLTEKALRDILLRLAVKIGLGKTEKVQGSMGSTYKKYVGKPIAWTMLRRAHATFCLKNFKSASLAARRVWGNEASTMVKVYSGLVDADSNEAYAEAMGMKPKTNGEETKIREVTCFKCGKHYPPTQSFCTACGIELDLKKIYEKQTWRELKAKEMQTRMAALEWKLEELLKAGLQHSSIK